MPLVFRLIFHKRHLDLHIFIFFDQPWSSINNSILHCILLTDMFDAPQICGRLDTSLSISVGNISFIYSCIFNSTIHIEEEQFYLMGTNEYYSFPPFYLKMDTQPSLKCCILKMFQFNRQWTQSTLRSTVKL
jgi:hypothetical protein